LCIREIPWKYYFEEAQAGAKLPKRKKAPPASDVAGQCTTGYPVTNAADTRRGVSQMADYHTGRSKI
jgi:hypothetical protein